MPETLSTPATKHPETQQLVTDTDITTLTSIIAEQLKKDSSTIQSGTSDPPIAMNISPRPEHSQRIQFNLINHRGDTR
jgi:hypothetical protein